VVRSCFEHLRASGFIILNPASTRLVSPPALLEGTAVRALTPREALIPLARPDRRKAEGACDHSASPIHQQALQPGSQAKQP